jgi:general stress protein CsbA
MVGLEVILLGLVQFNQWVCIVLVYMLELQHLEH